MNYLKIIAAVGVTTCAMMLIVQGDAQNAMVLLVGELSFFVGEQNGINGEKKKVSSDG